MAIKTGRLDGRVEVGDILEIREGNQKTEFLRVESVQDGHVTIVDVKAKRAKPETWEIEDLGGMAVYSSRSAASLAPRQGRSIEMSDAEYCAVREFLKASRKACK